MSKKRAWIGAIVIMVVWFAIWGFGIAYLSNIVNDASNQGFIAEAEEFLKADEDFASKYGQITAIEAQNEKPVGNSTSEVTQYYMDFLCATANGEFNIRVYCTWEDSWVHSYEELPSN